MLSFGRSSQLRPDASERKPCAVLWPSPRDPKCTPTQGIRRRDLQTGRRNGCRHRPAELPARVRQLLALPRNRTVSDRIEYRMIRNTLAVLASDAERDGAPDLVHGFRDIDVGGLDRRLHGAVAATDVVADPGRNHHPVGRHHAADRHRIALVMIGAQHAAARLARHVEAPFQLLERSRLDLAKRDQFVHPTMQSPRRGDPGCCAITDSRRPAARTTGHSGRPRAATPRACRARYLPVGDHRDAIGDPHRREAMRDHDADAAFQDLFELGENRGLGLGVERRRWARRGSRCRHRDT